MATVRKLIVEVVEARNISPKDGHRTSSLYVVVDYHGQRKRTKTAIQDLNPVWNELLEFNVGKPSNVCRDVLELNVYHDRNVGPTRRNNFLGRIRLSSTQFVKKVVEALIYFPLEKKNFFSWIQGDIGLKIYYVDELVPSPAPPSQAKENKAETTPPPQSSSSASTGSSIYVFGGGAATSIANNQSQSSTLFGVGNGSPAGTGVASFAQSSPTQPGSSTSSPSFGLARNTALSSCSSVFLSTSAAKLFSSGVSTVLGSSTSSLEANPISSSTTPSLFGSSWKPAKAPIFASTFNSTSLSTGFSFGLSSTSAATNSAPIGSGASSASAATTNNAPMFGSSNGAPSTSFSSFNPSASTQPAFVNLSPAFSFSSSPEPPVGNSDKMSMEDSMAEDTVQASTPTASMFGAAGPSVLTMVNPFQFASQQNPSPFQASGSFCLTT